MHSVDTKQQKVNKRILLIDDNESIHEDFRQVLGAEIDTSDLEESKAAVFGDMLKLQADTFEIDSAFQGQEGLEMVTDALKKGRPYAMAFVDVRMPPGWDGIETIQQLWKVQTDLQVVICTAFSDHSWSDVIRKFGKTEQLLILKKPFDIIEVQQLACSLTEKWNLLNNLEKMVKHRTEQIAQTRDLIVFTLAGLTESRDPETGEHLERMRIYCQILAEELRANSPYSNQIDNKFIENLYRSSPLHDVGKVGIPDKILLKPGALTETEFDIMRQHTTIGAETLEKSCRLADSGGFLEMAVDIAKYHHERFNGTGYMEGLGEYHIPLSARIVALADVYDALTSARVYKEAFRPEVAKLMIEEERGEHFDPEIVDVFLARYEDILKVRKRMDSSDAALINSIAYGNEI